MHWLGKVSSKLLGKQSLGEQSKLENRLLDEITSGEPS